MTAAGENVSKIQNYIHEGNSHLQWMQVSLDPFNTESPVCTNPVYYIYKLQSNETWKIEAGCSPNSQSQFESRFRDRQAHFRRINFRNRCCQRTYIKKTIFHSINVTADSRHPSRRKLYTVSSVLWRWQQRRRIKETDYYYLIYTQWIYIYFTVFLGVFGMHTLICYSALFLSRKTS